MTGVFVVLFCLFMIAVIFWPRKIKYKIIESWDSNGASFQALVKDYSASVFRQWQSLGSYPSLKEAQVKVVDHKRYVIQRGEYSKKIKVHRG